MENFKCPLCKKSYVVKDALYDHMQSEHAEDLHGLPAAQIYFNFKNRYDLNKQHGKCVMTGKPTKFNLTTERYERFADENARLAYREYFRKNMIKRYGKDMLLDEPDQQKKMLANRGISGVYTWTSGHTSTYTGSYERKFLEFLDLQLHWENPGDIMSPSPVVFPYKDGKGGVQRFHIPDFYISSLNLIINVKSSDNQHYRLRDIETEMAQDKAIENSKYNYLKLYDNNFERFLEIIHDINKAPKNKKVVFLMEQQTA
jgi:hypothetical protein